MKKVNLIVCLMLFSIQIVASDSFQEIEGDNENLTNNLTCLCHGGPGNYPYACAPVERTCYGGPGNYPYQCLVCLEPLPY